MLIAEITIEQLERWVQEKLPTVDQSEPVQFHVLAQGYEMRCADLPPLRLEPHMVVSWPDDRG